MDRRFAVVNLKTDQIVRRETHELAMQCLQGIEDEGGLGMVLDGREGEVVAASRIPFHIDTERATLFVAGIGLDVETMHRLESLRVPALIMLDRAEDGLLSVSEAPKDIEVDGVRVALETLKVLKDAAGAGGKPLRTFIADGMLCVLVLPEPVSAPFASPGDCHGGIAVPVKGDPEKLETHESAPESTLAAADTAAASEAPAQPAASSGASASDVG